MSTIVKNIVERSYPIPDDTLALFKQLGVEKFTPSEVPRDLTFELHNTTTEMANALRRCINSELTVLAMDFDVNNVYTDDSFIITDELKTRIKLIPIRQISDMTFSLNVTNPLDVIIPIYSSQIHKSGDTGAINGELMFAGSNILTYLRPGKYLRIENIKTVSGVGYIDGPAFSFPGKVGYSCIELEQMCSGADGGEKDPLKTPVSSMESNPSKYRLVIPRQKFIDPMQIINIALDTLSDKINKLSDIIGGTIGNLYTSDIEITYTPGSVTVKIFRETYTIGNMIVRYGMDVDASITNIHCIKPYQSVDYITVEIRHPDPKKIMMLSMKKIQEELTSIREAF